MEAAAERTDELSVAGLRKFVSLPVTLEGAALLLRRGAAELEASPPLSIERDIVGEAEARVSKFRKVSFLSLSLYLLFICQLGMTTTPRDTLGRFDR